jgi:hypothetical protein
MGGLHFKSFEKREKNLQIFAVGPECRRNYFYLQLVGSGSRFLAGR